MPHRVENQPPPLADYNLWRANPMLRQAVHREGAAWAESGLDAHGQQLGTTRMQELAALANRNPPVLQTHDRYGHRLDRVDFHPAWHELLSAGVAAGLHSSPWAEPRPGAHVARAAAFMLHAEVENGTLCPLSMTYGSASSFAQAPDLARDWLPAIFTREYDPRATAVQGKRGALIGMGMTEKQGGSDVRANATLATPAGVAALVLARTSEPPCFSVMPMPINAPRLPCTAVNRGSYSRVKIAGSQSRARSGAWAKDDAEP